MYTFFACFTDICCPLLESDLAYSDDDVPSVYENGLSQKSFNKAKENFNFLHLNRYISLENLYICIYIFIWRRKWQPTPVFLLGESQGQRSLLGCHLWGCAESDTTDAT